MNGGSDKMPSKILTKHKCCWIDGIARHCKSIFNLIDCVFIDFPMVIGIL